MSRINWDETYSVHNAEIDEQHKKWIEIYNNIHDVLIGDSTSSLANITTDSLTAMSDYARYHFNFEEKYLEQINYPHRIEHRRLHRDFENQIYRYTREIEAGETLLNTRLLKIIGTWLVDHIKGEDKKYSAFAQRDLSPER